MLQAAKYIGGGLATIGLTKLILSPITSSRLLCPSVISPTAKVAINVVDEMLKSLPSDGTVIKHIAKVAEQSESMLQVTAKVEGDLVIPNTLIEFPNGNIPENSVTKERGVYAFTDKKALSAHPDGLEQAFGSAIGFPRRLADHKDQFNGKSRQTALHKSRKITDLN